MIKHRNSNFLPIDILEVNKPKKKESVSKNSAGEFFIPVDYETYAKWMAEKQNQRLQSPKPQVVERKQWKDR